MLAITSEKVQGVLDDATYTATLCLARDGKHYFFSAIEVDGNAIGVPGKRWSSRKAALHALSLLAQGSRKGESGAPLPVSGDSGMAEQPFRMEEFDALHQSDASLGGPGDASDVSPPAGGGPASRR
ncbi:hypothetical protein [Diaphorobacter ruginosibacter]|uniref:hypothetical protein n=1 Tax=Diaphorobacter ruginosibacter TaxID=1715720 RepID=UPI00333FD4A5